MHKSTNQTLIPSPARRRRGFLPELGQIEELIDRNRALRLELVGLALTYEPVAESARAGVEALIQQVGLALEKIAELLVGAQTRKRSHHRKLSEQTPSLPEEPLP